MKSNTFSPKVCVIGGANIDIIGIPNGSFIMKDSNPGIISMSCGGVGRNIAENISLLGVQTHLITALGNDMYGELILKQSSSSGINMEGTFIIDNCNTSVYLAILDKDKDMITAISHMDIYGEVTSDHLESQRQLIDSCDICLLDTNLPRHIIEYIVKSFAPGVFMLDTVSSRKALRAKSVLGHFHTIKPNKVEAEALWGKPVQTIADAHEACSYFISLGIKQVFITLGQNGVYYSNGQVSGHFVPPPSPVANATGAGDAFSAALAYCHINAYSIDKAAIFASAAASLALSHKKTICPELCVDNINRIIKEWKI